MRADGSGEPRLLLSGKGRQILQIPRSVTPDGKRLAFVEAGERGQLVSLAVPLEDRDGQLIAGTPEAFVGVDSAFSPDGRWFAYSTLSRSPAGTVSSIYVRAFPAPSSGEARQWPIANEGSHPVWSRTTNELLYRSGDQIMAVSYTVKGETFVADKPRVWIAKLGGTLWDLAPNGKRVAVVTPEEAPEAPKPDHEVVLLLNFFDYLRRRAPVK
jgi:Tol biopolymer transport system component